ncbi:LacI family DNA-binding transcriptional regulator [Nakamurella deserti]|uniref:LacI family DNA-binding transcriptional regulator n=1 Tax=Nakamurella deserti TaxID=2164074 RepID=UPI000DBE8186
MVGGGARRATMHDVAARAGVSQSLVSIVMRDAPGAGAATRERILRIADELGYRPDTRARLLRRGNSRLLGVVFGVQHAFHGDLLAGLYRAAAPLDYQLTLSAVTADRGETAAITDLLGDRCEALLLLGTQEPPAQLGRLAAIVPVVAVARAVRHSDVDVVRTADAHGLAQAVDHLVGLGHTRIAHIDGGRAPGAAERRRGYRDAMTRHGLAGHIRVYPGGLTEDDGAGAARTVLADGPPTAITVFNDRCATGVLEIVRAAGFDVPGDISVIGYDDSHLARISFIDLTTIAQDVDRLAHLAVHRAVDRATGADRDGPREQVATPHLVVRSTTGPPHAGRRPAD